MTTFAVCTQNMTEGKPTHEAKAADVFLSQERPSSVKMRLGLPGKRHYFPVRERHMGVSWNPKRLHVARTDKGYHQFHGSSKREGWHGIKSPSRGLAWVTGHDLDGAVWTFWTTWLLNSWDPMHHDKWTADRHKIVRDLELPVVTDWLAHFRTLGSSVGGGDINTLKNVLHFTGYTPSATHGLDRLWWSDDLDKVSGPHEGPKTGVGPQMEHNSVTIRVANRPERAHHDRPASKGDVL